MVVFSRISSENVRLRHFAKSVFECIDCAIFAGKTATTDAQTPATKSTAARAAQVAAVESNAVHISHHVLVDSWICISGLPTRK